MLMIEVHLKVRAYLFGNQSIGATRILLFMIELTIIQLCLFCFTLYSFGMI